MSKHQDLGKETKFHKETGISFELLICLIGLIVASLSTAYGKHGYLLIAVVLCVVGWRQASRMPSKDGKIAFWKNGKFWEVTCIILGVAFAAIFMYKGEKQRAHTPNQINQVFVENSYSNSIIIAIRRGRYSLPDDAQCNILHQDDDGKWIIERSMSIEGKDLLIVRTLEPGIYKAELDFYGITLAVVENISIDNSKGQYVEIVSQGSVGFLKFIILKEDGSVLKNAHVVVYSQGEIPIRFSDTNAAGRTEDLWVASVLYPDNYYIAKVYYPGKTGLVIAESEKISIRFDRPSQSKTITIKTSIR